jgi:DNA-directed RNA polymerase alpha subunit
MTGLLDEIRRRAESKNYASVGGAVTMTQVEADRRILLRLLDETAARLPIEELGLDTRTHRILAGSGIRHVGELLRMTEDDVTDLRNSGTKTLENVKDRLRDEFGLTLRQGQSR